MSDSSWIDGPAAQSVRRSAEELLDLFDKQASKDRPMTEIPEHLMRRAAEARKTAEYDNQPDPSLNGRGVTVELRYEGDLIFRFKDPDLTTPAARTRMAGMFIDAMSGVIRQHNRDQVIAAEVDIQQIGNALNVNPAVVADALAKLPKNNR